MNDRDSGTGRRSARERSLIAGVIRLLGLAVLVGALTLGVAAFGLPVADDVLEPPNVGGDDGIAVPDELPPPSEEPPPAGDREPETVHPDDPNESGYETEVETVSSEAVEDFVHAEVNDRRAAHGVDPIPWDGTIASVSRTHSADMAERDYFSHTNPEGEDPYDRFDRVGDYCAVYGENLAMNHLETPVEESGGDDVVEHRTAEGIAEALVTQWMHSSGHREALLDDQWDRGGVGVYITDSGEVYATHNFCAER